MAAVDMAVAGCAGDRGWASQYRARQDTPAAKVRWECVYEDCGWYDERGETGFYSGYYAAANSGCNFGVRVSVMAECEAPTRRRPMPHWILDRNTFVNSAVHSIECTLRNWSAQQARH